MNKRHLYDVQQKGIFVQYLYWNHLLIIICIFFEFLPQKQDSCHGMIQSKFDSSAVNNQTIVIRKICSVQKTLKRLSNIVRKLYFSKSYM